MTRNYLNDPTSFLHICNYPPFEKDLDLNLNNLNSHHARYVCTKFDCNWPAGSGEDFSFNINISEYGFPNCGPSRPPGTIISWNLNLHYIRKLPCKYDLFWLSGSGDWRRFLNDPTPFLHFCDYLPFEEDLTLYLNNLEFPLPKDDFCQV
jgi:hypothetical protein